MEQGADLNAEGKSGLRGAQQCRTALPQHLTSLPAFSPGLCQSALLTLF